MTDILRRLHCTIRCDIETAESGCHCAEGRDTITALRAEVERRKAGYTATQHDIQQTLGKALGYPWFKDDPTNFPTAIEADGVCVGDHVAESLADEAAAKITALRAKVERLEADLATARADALEEAARCAKQNAAETWTDPNAADTRGIMRLQAEDIAAAIRALATQP